MKIGKNYTILIRMYNDSIAELYTLKPRQNGRRMTSFRGAMAKLGAGVDTELIGSAPVQISGCGLDGVLS